MTRESYKHIQSLAFEPRPDYGVGVEVAWSHDLADTYLGWECTSDACNDPMDDDVYRGWAKWQRIVRRIDTGEVLSVSIECGHCGTEYDVTSEV